MAGAPDANIPPRSVHLQRGTSTIQPAFSSKRLRPPFVAFAADVNIGKLGSDVVPVANVHTGPHVDRYIGGNVHRDITRTRFQIGVVTLAPRIHQLHGDSARTGLRFGRRHTVELNAAAAGLCVNVPFSRGQVNAAAAGFNLRWTANVAQVHTAAAGRNLHLAIALPHLHAAAAGLNDRALRPGLNLDTASSGFCHDFAVGMPYLDGTPAGVQAEVAADRANIDRPASGFGGRSPTNVIQLHGPAAAFRFHPAGDPRGIHVPTLGFQFEQCHLARNHYGKFAGEVAWSSSALPISHDPGGVAFHVRGDLVLFELPAGILLGRIAEMSMNHVIDALLLPATYDYGAHVNLDS